MALISKEDLLTKFETGALLFQPEVKRIIKIQPEVDAVPVVQCKDCINFTQGKDEWGSCFENPMKMWRDTDYCSLGERRTDE